MARVKGFDGLRALAVLAVMLFHIDAERVGGGWVGVDLFFVLSGFLITMLLLGEHARTGRIALADFYVRRAARLYPALILLVVAAAPGAWYLGYRGEAEGYVLTAAVALAYLTDVAIYLSGTAYGRFTHTWSLAVEEHFYLLWPLVVVLVRGRRRLVLGVALAGATASYLATVLGSHRTVFAGTPVSYFAPHTRAFELLLGAALAAVMFARAGRAPGRRAAGLLVPLGLVGLVAVAGYASVVPRSEAFSVQLLGAGVTSCVLVLGVYLAQGSWFVAALEWAPLAWLGTVSYGVYLFHYPILRLAERLLGSDPLLLAVVGLPLTLAAAALSARFVEQPVRDWARSRLMAPRAPVRPEPAQPVAAAAARPAVRPENRQPPRKVPSSAL